MKSFIQTNECVECRVEFIGGVKDFVLSLKMDEWDGIKIELGPYCRVCKEDIKHYFSLVKKDG